MSISIVVYDVFITTYKIPNFSSFHNYNPTKIPLKFSWFSPATDCGETSTAADSTNTKFCYYNKSHPRHFCKSCKRHWTKGGALRNIPFHCHSRAAASAQLFLYISSDMQNDMSDILYQALVRFSSSPTVECIDMVVPQCTILEKATVLVANDPYWLPMIDGIAEYGKGFKPPTMHELRTWVLKAEVDDINIIYEDHKKAWKTYGCTIMLDGWTDQKQRALMNFLVNSPAGTFFIKSVDVSDSIKNGELIFKYLDEVIDEVGENNVIQIITDNASNCKNAGKRIMEARKSLWWTPCAAHCIDLMLEDIAKLKIFEEVIENAKKVVKFIYGHGTILALMRKHTNDKELLRPAVTRFATAFLTLQSMYKQKGALEVMFSSDEWVTSAQAKKTEGKVAKRIVVNDPNFWPYVAFCVKSVVPLVSVLREVDSEERP
ncbi:hypothetical protein OROHE_026524 [Orobanche hederae]